MKRTLLSVFFCLLAVSALRAQITITASDMPVVGDMLRYSIALPTSSVNLSNTGANIAWDYSTLNPIAQSVDTYKTAIQAGYTGGGIPSTAFGYKVADSLTFPGAPASATNVYTFFNVKTGPSRFVAEGFGAKLNGAIPIAGGYSNEDTIYSFPLTYNGVSNTSFKLSITVPFIGSLKQVGTRQTRVDGWGTIKTPFFTTPVAALRVRSEVTEIDSIAFGATTIGVPRHYVEYKWLANGEHYPALFVTTTIVTGTTETPTGVRYRDSERNLLGVSTPAAATEALQVYPNPATGAQELHVRIPATWVRYVVHVYDATGKLLREVSDTPKINTEALPSGQYLIVAESGSMLGVAQFVK